METGDSDLVRDLLANKRLLALSLIVEGEPYVGQLPFAARPDFSALLVHVSRLARHSRGLMEGAPFSSLVQGIDAPGEDPFQVPRLTLSGAVAVIDRGTVDYESAKSLYLAKLPSGKVTFSLGDFRMCELRVDTARLVAGFGRTANLTRGLLAAAARPVSVEGGP